MNHPLTGLDEGDTAAAGRRAADKDSLGECTGWVGMEPFVAPDSWVGLSRRNQVSVGH